MDMVGRLDKHLILQGVGSSSIWRGEIERRNAPVGLPITLQDDSYLPTDASSFYLKGSQSATRLAMYPGRKTSICHNRHSL